MMNMPTLFNKRSRYIDELLIAAGAMWYAIAAVIVLGLMIMGDVWALATLPFLVVLHHGGHEAGHGMLVPSFFGHWRKSLNNILGVIGFSIVGHNYLLMRASHNFHHLCGRFHDECTIDYSSRNLGLCGVLRYYILLLGASYWSHEIAGYAYLSPRLGKRIFGATFKPERYKHGLYIFTQLYVFGWTVLCLVLFGWWWIIAKALFGIYWGMGQNVAHYALPVREDEIGHLISRTYRVPRWLNFMFFGSGFHHAEHHAFPSRPGLLLSKRDVQEELGSRYGLRLLPREGFLAYLHDVFAQLKGPFPKFDERPFWHKV